MSAFTLFSLEFYAARALLPVYGGSSHVWTTCMVWYLAVIWLGYLASWWIAPGQILLPGSLAVLGLTILVTVPLPASYVPGDVPDLLLNLTLHLGGVFFLLACISPAVQRKVEQETSTAAYHLVAWSNAGSLTAVLSFPFVLQSALSLHGQRSLLAASAAVVFAGLLWLLRHGPAGAPHHRPTGHCRMQWVLLSAGSTAWMLAITHFVSTEITAHLLLWAVTLALFLGTYVLCFQSRRQITIAWLALPTTLAAAAAAAYRWTETPGFGVAAHLAMLWTGCLVANRALALSVLTRRDSPYWFYVSIGLGGALGGLVMCLAPVGLGDWFPFSEFDYIVALWIVTLGLLWTRPAVTRIAVTAGLAGVLALRTTLDPEEVVYAERNFYGLNRVTQTDTHRFLYSGVTFHGVLDLQQPHLPLAYYHHDSPAGEILQSNSYPKVLSIGLGIGALLSYIRPGDQWTVIELDPAVLHIAQHYFPYLQAAGNQVTCLEGDGRRVLTSLNEQFDLIIVDAFSSDSIPTHLLTREAFQLYRAHLTEHGELLFHLSSRHVDLAPVFRSHAASFDLPIQAKEGNASSAFGTFPSTWFLVGRPRKTWTPLEGHPQVPWTDQHIPLLPLLLP